MLEVLAAFGVLPALVFVVGVDDVLAEMTGEETGVLVHRGATYWFPVVPGGDVVPLLLRDRL